MSRRVSVFHAALWAFVLLSADATAAGTKLSQIASGGNANVTTDQAVAVRSGTTDVLVNLTGLAPGGATTDIQFNNAGTFGGSGNFTFTNSTGDLLLNSADTSGNSFTLNANSITSGNGELINCNALNGGKCLWLDSSSAAGGDILQITQSNASYSGDGGAISYDGTGRALYLESTGNVSPTLVVSGPASPVVQFLDGLQGYGDVNTDMATLQVGQSTTIPYDGTVTIGQGQYADWSNAGFTATTSGDLLVQGQIQIGAGQGSENFPRYSGTAEDVASAVITNGDISLFSQALASCGGESHFNLGDTFHYFAGVACDGLRLSSYNGNSDPINLGFDLDGVNGGPTAGLTINYNSGNPVGIFNGAYTVKAFTATGAVNLSGISSTTAAQTGTLCWKSGGNVTYDPSLGCLSSVSKIKDNITSLNGGIWDVMRLRPVSYIVKPGLDEFHLGPQIGFVAEEVQKVDDRLVGYNDNTGELRGVRYMQMSALMASAIQDLQYEVIGLVLFVFLSHYFVYVIRKRGIL